MKKEDIETEKKILANKLLHVADDFLKSHDEVGDIEINMFTTAPTMGMTDEGQCFTGRNLMCNVTTMKYEEEDDDFDDDDE